MTIYTSERGYYGVYYRSDKTIELPADTEVLVVTSTKFNKEPGYETVLLTVTDARKLGLNTAVAWRAK